MSKFTGSRRRSLARVEQDIWLGPILMGFGLTMGVVLLIAIVTTGGHAGPFRPAWRRAWPCARNLSK